jgi:hypothetical protein
MIADRAFWLDVKTTIRELFHPEPVEPTHWPESERPVDGPYGVSGLCFHHLSACHWCDSAIRTQWVQSHRRTDQWEIVPAEEEGA